MPADVGGCLGSGPVGHIDCKQRHAVIPALTTGVRCWGHYSKRPGVTLSTIMNAAIAVHGMVLAWAHSRIRRMVSSSRVCLSKWKGTRL